MNVAAKDPLAFRIKKAYSNKHVAVSLQPKCVAKNSTRNHNKHIRRLVN
jgi:hypothetical protein